MALLMDGARLRDEVVADLAATIAAAGAPPVRLAIVHVGNDVPHRAYAGYKHAAAHRAGMQAVSVALPATASQAEVEDAVGRAGTDPGVHGVFVQLPLAGGLDTQAVLDVVPVDKDVDGLGERNLGRLVRGAAGQVPCAARAVVGMLERYERPTAGRRVVVLGRTWPLALPLSVLLARPGADATVTVAHARSEDLAGIAGEADILISAIGRPGLVTAGWVRAGATVIDAGTTRTADGPAGDVDVASVWERAGAICPSPGGLGPATVAFLLSHTLDAARRLGAFPPVPPDPEG
ncbi:MAG: tetrahydrofolate dehydrogenase/cyclohydrolase catalytic domain-containing protein [Acidimicrobiia bacterium]